MSKLREDENTGFANRAETQGQRLLNHQGRFMVQRTGLSVWTRYHLYLELTTMPWWLLGLLIFALWIVVNLIFTGLYLLVGLEHLTGYMPESGLSKLEEAFFFSTQTLSTLGYGRLNPMGFWANMVAAFESFIGLLSFALATGVLYGRFSKATAKLVYSKNAIISPYKHGKALMFRVANRKKSILVEPEAEVILAVNDAAGTRHYYNLNLERKRVSYLALSWTLVHPIDDHSPFVALEFNSLSRLKAELIITIKGFDTTFNATVYSHYSYTGQHIVVGAKFKRAFHPSADGQRTILRLDKISDIEPATLPH